MKLILEITALFLLGSLSLQDIKTGKIENKKLIYLWMVGLLIAISEGNYKWLLIRTVVICFILLLFSNYFPYQYIGGGDIKMVGISFCFLGSKIFTMLGISLFIAVIFGLLANKKRIRLAPFLSFGLFVSYFI